VREFVVEGDLPIARERALAVLAPYAGESVELGQLQNATTALETELAAQGYPFYRVVLPPQSLEGTVTVRVLPFKLAK
jgi:hemolysin activation/secretion protein